MSYGDNRTHNERIIYVLVINGNMVRAYSEEPEAQQAKQKIMMTRPQDQPLVAGVTFYDKQTIDSKGYFNKLNTAW